MQTALTPTAQAILEFLEEVLQDLAHELCESYDEVFIRLSISAR